MEMLVTKFSNGKYRNEGELFAEPISNENVKLMGEMIALQALRTVKKFDMKVADRLYIGLIKDLHHMSEIDYIVSDGYDVAQTAICFLYQFVGHTANEIYGKDRKGKEISIKLACYREVDRFINLLRNRPDRRGTVVESIDFTDYKALPMDPVNCFEQEQTNYTKYDELVGALQLKGKMPEDICISFIQKYSDEQKRLEAEIAELETRLTETTNTMQSADEFIRNIKKYLEAPELTREMCYELLDRVVVGGHPKHTGKERVIDIVYKVDIASVLRYKLNNSNT